MIVWLFLPVLNILKNLKTACILFINVVHSRLEVSAREIQTCSRGEETWPDALIQPNFKHVFSVSNVYVTNFSSSEVTTLWYYTTHTRLTALCPGLPRWAGTRKVKPIWILLEQETVSLSGISWAICKSASRSRQITTPAPHLSFLQAGCLSCCPTNSVKALKAMFIIIIIIIIIVCNVYIECTYFGLFLDFGNKLSSLKF